MNACAGSQIDTAAAVMLNIVRMAKSRSLALKRSDAANASTAATSAAHSGPNDITEVNTSVSDSENRVSILGSFIMKVPVTMARPMKTSQLAPGARIIVRREAIRMADPAAMTIARKKRAGVVSVTYGSLRNLSNGTSVEE